MAKKSELLKKYVRVKKGAVIIMKEKTDVYFYQS